ncbi:MAG: hypothetical protein AAF975_00550 [Spirochaetota bacterium]
MSIETIFVHVIIPVLMLIFSATITFLFRRTDALHTETVRQDERIRHLGSDYHKLEQKLDQIEQDLRELPDRIVKRIRDENR